VGLIYKDANVYTTSEPEFLDDGPMKPIRLWSRIGRRPIFAAGNSNGDIEMLQFTAASSGPSLQLLVLHDDADREFDYVTGAEKALEHARTDDWTVVWPGFRRRPPLWAPTRTMRRRGPPARSPSTVSGCRPVR
jgi:hypothetical protein